jgi:formylglycine-generating enzyme required for sulfatase activity
MLRGGSWYDSPINCRVAYRQYPLTNARKDTCGFRVTLEGSPNPHEITRDVIIDNIHRIAGEEVDFEVANNIKMRFCWIPSGTAVLGAARGGADANFSLDEYAYTSRGFWLGKYEVTQEEWTSVMGTKDEWISFRPGGKNAEPVRGMDIKRFPAESISWNNCQEFLSLINQRDGIAKAFGKNGKFVLPHEDEWEYAYRGGKGNKQPFYWGDTLNGDFANCDGNKPYGPSSAGTYLQRPTPVGLYEKKTPHPWGLCDVSGNVWEWCENKYDRVGNDRVLRGGSWYNSASFSVGAFRLSPTVVVSRISF